MSITLVNEPHARYLVGDGEEWDDFIETVEDQFGYGPLTLEFVRMFDDIESFWDTALRDLYGVDFFSDMFADGVVEVNDKYLRMGYGSDNSVTVLEDLYGHRIYAVRKV
jgi:hypothetical protein